MQVRSTSKSDYTPGMERDPDIQREWLRLFDRFVLRLIELKPESVLDVGCGRGVLVNQLSQAGILATGLDPGQHHDRVVGLAEGGVDRGRER